MTYSDADHPLPLILRRVVNRLAHPFGMNPFPRAFHYGLTPERAQAFDAIYAQNLWGSAESRSGVGSELAKTAPYRAGLAALIRARGIRAMFDAPCGDLQWMPALLRELPELRYEGGDISPSLITSLQTTHPGMQLRTFDITRDAFPEAEVWHCRDCLFHLPFADIRAAFANFARSSIPYALLTTHRARWLHRNLNLAGVGFRLLDLEHPPISLPRPLAYIADYRPGHEFPRYVGLWSREAIAAAVARLTL